MVRLTTAPPAPAAGVLLDTGILIDAVADPAGPLAARIRSTSAGRSFVSAVTAAELRVGPLLSADPAGETAKVEAALSLTAIVPFDDPAAAEHARLVAEFRAAGLAFQAFDSLIAATARLHGLTLVTRDMKMLRVARRPARRPDRPRLHRLAGPLMTRPAPSRRSFLAAAGSALAAGSAAALAPRAPAADPPERVTDEPQFKLSVAAYSFGSLLPRGGKKGEWSLDDVVDFAAEAGLPGVELTGYYFPKIVADADLGHPGPAAGDGPDPLLEKERTNAAQASRYLRALAHRCFVNGLTVSGTAIGNDFALPPGDARDREIAACKHWIDVAAVLGAPVIRIFAGKVPKGGDEAEAVARCAAGINECLPYAAERGVHLALENHGGITATPDQMLSIIERVDDSPWFGVNFDSGNFQTADPYGDLARIAPYALNAQIKPYMRPNGKKEEPDLKRVLGILADAGYRGWVAMEYEGGGDVREETKRWIEKVRAAMA